MYKNLPYQNIFCIGIGGIGVSGLAELLHQAGYIVSGADLSQTPITQHLQALGITVFQTHQADNVAGADLVIYTSAVNEKNPEMQAAKAAGIPALSRGQLLAKVMQAKCNIIVTGTHGKTTTTALASYLFAEAGVEPTCLIGGILQNQQSPFIAGQSDYFIAEADESDASFLYLSPTVAIITNIDADHMETYAHDFERLKRSFIEVTQKIPANGFVIACIDDPVVRSLLPDMACRVVTYGAGSDADYQLKNYQQVGLSTHFDLLSPDGALYPARVDLPGIHNALNAVAAMVAVDMLQLNTAVVAKALCGFPGVGRRFQYHGEIAVDEGSALLFDDYGHHPIEIRATLNAVRLAWPTRRLVLVFQPHRYSRTRDLLSEFVDVLKDVDQLLLAEVYAASEQHIPGADGQALFNLVQEAGGEKALFLPNLSQLKDTMAGLLKPDDIVILQGAGNIVTMADELLSM